MEPQNLIWVGLNADSPFYKAVKTESNDETYVRVSTIKRWIKIHTDDEGLLSGEAASLITIMENEDTQHYLKRLSAIYDEMVALKKGA
jgi:hypothetical protein